MILKKKDLNLFIILIVLLFFVLVKNYLLCDIFSDCSLTQEKYGGDLSKYYRNYTSNAVINYNGATIYLIFKYIHSWISFEFFLILYQLIFYIIIFSCGISIVKDYNLWKFILFTLVILFYPFYDGYSSFLLKQGTGTIFLLISLFLVKKVFSFSSFLFIIFSILSHYIFLLFYIIFYLIRFFSLKFLILIFIISFLVYSFGINDALYLMNINFIYNLDLFFVPEDVFSKLNQEDKLRFILFSSLPLFSLLVIQCRNVIYKNKFLKDLYKFHFLYSSLVYLLFSEFYYIDRFLSVTWMFYPFYFLAFLSIFKINFKNSKLN